MKKAWAIASVLALAAAAGFAEAPSDAAVHLAAIFEQPARAGSCAAARAGALPAAIGGPVAQNECTADCDPFTDVSCSGSGTCTAVDRSCPGERGYVTCDGITTFCPVCPEDPCEGLFGICYNCCQTNDCMACCRCGGGSFGQCAQQC